MWRGGGENENTQLQTNVTQNCPSVVRVPQDAFTHVFTPGAEVSSVAFKDTKICKKKLDLSPQSCCD